MLDTVGYSGIQWICCEKLLGRYRNTAGYHLKDTVRYKQDTCEIQAGDPQNTRRRQDYSVGVVCGVSYVEIFCILGDNQWQQESQPPLPTTTTCYLLPISIFLPLPLHSPPPLPATATAVCTQPPPLILLLLGTSCLRSASPRPAAERKSEVGKHTKTKHTT